MAGTTLRVQAPAGFMLRWTANEWQEIHDTRSTATSLGIEFVNIPILQEQRSPIRFTFHWLEADRWEGKDFEVTVENPAG